MCIDFDYIISITMQNFDSSHKFEMCRRSENVQYAIWVFFWQKGNWNKTASNKANASIPFGASL